MEVKLSGSVALRGVGAEERGMCLLVRYDNTIQHNEAVGSAKNMNTLGALLVLR